MSDQPGAPACPDPQDATHAKVVIDLSRISAEDFEPSRPLLVATMMDGVVIGRQTVVPGEFKDQRRLEVSLPLASQDGVAGAEVVVAPADDERNLGSDKVARKFVSGRGDVIDGGVLRVTPNIYRIWRFCWFPHTYHVSGRVVRQDGDCTHPVAAAKVELFDVDYCWWWYDEDKITSVTTDADGYFDVTFTWCSPLWCYLSKVRPPLYVDADLRDRLKEIVDVHFPTPPIPPGDPAEWEQMLVDIGVGLPSVTAAKLSRSVLRKPKWTVDDLFGHIIFWPYCSDPCDRRPDVRIRVTQDQPGAGTVEIYRDTYSQIRWNLAGDLLDLRLEANELALHADDCRPDPILGNCMLFEGVGGYLTAGIYEPDIVLGGASYGTTPDRSARLGRTADYDRAWCLTPSVHGDFGLASQVDYYQVQVARWTNADMLAWEADNRHVPSPSSFAAVSPDALGDFHRAYYELVTIFGIDVHVWRGEHFFPDTVGGIDGLYKSRAKFEQEYRDAHGGNDPAEDYASGWYWSTDTKTRLFDIDTVKLGDGLYTFRIVGYHQTGVDATGEPTLVEVDMGLADGVCKRCAGANGPVIPELLTMRVVNNLLRPTCAITELRKNGSSVVGECDIVVLDEAVDWLEIDFTASSPLGELDSYGLNLQRGSAGLGSVFGLPGVTVTGSAPRGPSYAAALADAATPASAPVWTGGSWTATVPAAAFGGSCAFDLDLDAYNRQTNGGYVGDETHQHASVAFTLILAADRQTFCDQLGCADLDDA
jgi:hypothetical protein